MRIRQLAPEAEALKIQGKTVVAARTVVLAAIAALALIPAAPARQASSAANGASASSTTPADPLAAAARRAKEEKKRDSKPAKVFTNDNMPAVGGVSTVGSAPADADASSGNKSASSGATTAAPAQGEAYWRGKFDKLNKKLEQDQSELDVMQRELGQLSLQNYSDPNKAMQQGYSHSDIDKKTAEISAKQKEIDADKQAISDAQDDLRKSGGDPGWAR
jgi:parvulin-like peptidyl-prolyl isomerase